MDLRNILSPGSAGEQSVSKKLFRNHGNHASAPGFLTAAGSTAAGNDETKPLRDVRSIVARRFMLMNEAHDRVRMKLLAPHPPQAR